MCALHVSVVILIYNMMSYVCTTCLCYYSALTQFFKVFDDYQKNDFYITGEVRVTIYIIIFMYIILINTHTHTHTYIRTYIHT